MVLLPYPLGYPMDDATRERDLRYYAERTDENGPAMTWAMHAIGYNDLGTDPCLPSFSSSERSSCPCVHTLDPINLLSLLPSLSPGKGADAASSFNRSFQPYVRGPFAVWSETPTGGVPHFLTGAGGFLQALTAGYAGLRWEDEALRLRPRCIEGASLIRLRGLVYRGSTLLLEYDCDAAKQPDAADAPGTQPSAVAVERLAAPNDKAAKKGAKMRVKLVSPSLDGVKLGLVFEKGEEKHRVTVDLEPGRAVQMPLREVRIVALQPKADK